MTVTADTGPDVAFVEYLATRAADPSMTFRRHLRERRASIEE
jgi:hypothetical protein